MGSYLISYLKATWRMLACFAALMGAMNLVLALSIPIREAWSEVGYLDLLLLVMAAAAYGYGFMHYRSRHRKIWQALQTNESLVPALEPNARAEDMRILSDCICHEADLTESQRLKLESELREQRDILTCWAHDVKTPLAVCSLILEKPQAEQVRQPIREQLSRIEAQVSGVLHAERLRHLDQSLGMVRMNMPGLLRAAIARSAALMQARLLELMLDAPAVEAMGDEQCVSYIMDQMLTNAAKYAPEGSQVDVKLLQTPHCAQLIVTNGGTPIEQQHIGRVFDKGFSGEQGSGMGLYYAQQTAQALGGRIIAQSDEQGTSFTLELPRFQEYLAPASVI